MQPSRTFRFKISNASQLSRIKFLRIAVKSVRSYPHPTLQCSSPTITQSICTLHLKIIPPCTSTYLCLSHIVSFLPIVPFLSERTNANAPYSIILSPNFLGRSKQLLVQPSYYSMVIELAFYITISSTGLYVFYGQNHL